MNEILQEFVDSRDAAMRIDRSRGIIRGVKLLGLISRNGHHYLPQALEQAAGLYEGAKVNVNHPKGHPLAARDYQDRLGHIRNVTMRAREGLFGDLHFNPRHAVAEQLLWDAAHAPQNVGLSHNVEARTSRRDGQMTVEAILSVHSVDLVADPATTQSLFEGAGPESGDDASAVNRALLQEALAALTFTELCAERPDLVEQVAAEAFGEIARLETEVASLRVQKQAHERRALAIRILKEYDLPDPEWADAAVRPIVSELFLETLVAAPDEQTMRRLAAERASILAAAGSWQRPGSLRPRSREQHRTGSTSTVSDALSFARAIT